jgi:hypothetical protein
MSNLSNLQTIALLLLAGLSGAVLLDLTFGRHDRAIARRAEARAARAERRVHELERRLRPPVRTRPIDSSRRSA